MKTHFSTTDPSIAPKIEERQVSITELSGPERVQREGEFLLMLAEDHVRLANGDSKEQAARKNTAKEIRSMYPEASLPTEQVDKSL